MKVLALELSSGLGSIAFRDGASAPIVRQFPADRKDSALFYENLQAIRRECGLAETIAVGLGPGSYAGIRIAIATALGLRASARARLVGVPSICTFALPEYCVIGDARRGSYFFARVQQGRCLEGLLLANADELRSKMKEFDPLPVVSTESLAGFEKATLAHPSATLLAELAENSEPSETLEPIYLRQPYITVPKAEPWIR